jgi:hypothetical protein
MSTRSVNGHGLFPDLRLMISRMGVGSYRRDRFLSAGVAVVNSCHLGLRAIRAAGPTAMVEAEIRLLSALLGLGSCHSENLRIV